MTSDRSHQTTSQARLDQVLMAKVRSITANTILTAIAFGFFLHLVQLGTPLYSMQVFDRVVPSSHLQTLAALTILLLFVTACSLFIDASRGILLARCSHRIAAALEKAVSDRLVAQIPSTFGYNDLDVIKSFISSHTMIALLDLPWTFLYVASLFYIQFEVGAYAIVCITVLLSTSFISRCFLTNIETMFHATDASAQKLMISMGQQPFINPATGRLSGLLIRVHKARLKTGDIQERLKARQAWLEAANRSLRSAMQIGVLAIATVLVVFQEVNAGAIVASSMIFTKAVSPIERLSSSVGTLRAFQRAWRQLSAECKSPRWQPTSMYMPAITGSLQLESVSLVSPPRIGPTLSAITLTLRPGALYVIVGSEGAGKSSLARILCGAERNYHGAVKLDGMSFSNYSLEQLNREIGYLPQHLIVRPMSVFEFIGRDSAADERAVFEAANTTGADAVIRQLSHGYQTQLYDDGVGVSHGQLRRIALASAIYGNPNLLVLDEPMLGMDEQGEHDVVEVVKKFKASGKTTVVVSKSVHFVHLADELILLEQGRIMGITNGSSLRSHIRPRGLVTL